MKHISFELAKLIKQLGFAWLHLVKIDLPLKLENGTLKGIGEFDGLKTRFNDCYEENGKLICPKMYNPKNTHYPAPYQSSLHKWLMDTHHIFVEIGPDWTSTVHFLNNYKSSTFEGKPRFYLHHHVTPSDDNDFWNSYEEALEQGLFWAINYLINEKS